MAAMTALPVQTMVQRRRCTPLSTPSGACPACPSHALLNLNSTTPNNMKRPQQKKPPRQFQASPMVPATSGETNAPRLMPM